MVARGPAALAACLALLVGACGISKDRPLTPQVTSISDASGDGIAVIGELVTLHGQNLGSSDLLVTIGGVEAIVSERASNQASARVPPGTPVGSVPVVADNQGRSSEPVDLVVRRLVYAANFTDQSLSVLALDGLDLTLLGEISVPVPPGPFAVEFTPDGTTAVVASSVAFLPQAIISVLAPGAPPGDSVAIVDTASGEVTAVLQTGENSKPTGVIVSPDSSTAYVTNYATSSISVIDLGIPAVVAEIPVPRQPEEVAITADGSLLLVNSDGGTVSTVDTASRQVAGTVETGGDDPSGVAFSPDGRTGYAVNSFVDPSFGEDGTLTVLDLSDPSAPRVTATIAEGIGPTPYDVQIAQGGELAVVTNLNVIFDPLSIGAGSVSILDLTADPPGITILDVGTAPIHAAIASSGGIALVGNGLAQTISVIDLVSRTVSSTVPLGTSIGPADVAIQP